VLRHAAEQVPPIPGILMTAADTSAVAMGHAVDASRILCLPKPFTHAAAAIPTQEARRPHPGQQRDTPTSQARVRGRQPMRQRAVVVLGPGVTRGARSWSRVLLLPPRRLPPSRSCPGDRRRHPRSGRPGHRPALSTRPGVTIERPGEPGVTGVPPTPGGIPGQRPRGRTIRAPTPTPYWEWNGWQRIWEPGHWRIQ
jgi:hypothetical protein